MISLLFLLHSYKATIVVTFSVLEDFTKELVKGTNHFEVCSIVKKTDDPHTFIVTPKDYVTLSKADILVENGIGFEAWLKDMVKNVNFKKKRVVASQGIIPMRFLKNLKIYDPHAWHNVMYAKIYIKNIANALIEADPVHKKIYEKNRDAYLKRLDALHIEILQLFKYMKFRKVMTTHDGFWYFGKAYNVEFCAPLGISTEEEPSSHNIAKLVQYIRKYKIKSAFFEAHTNNHLVQKIAEETSIKVGGILYGDTIYGNYIKTMRHNAQMIAGVKSSVNVMSFHTH